MEVPNPRFNALVLGARLLAAAANPWSGLSDQVFRKGGWLPLDPCGLPPWWPAGFQKAPVSLQAVELMRSAVPEKLYLRRHIPIDRRFGNDIF
jgi:hypothetical protein